MSTADQPLTAEDIAARALPDGLVCYNRTPLFSSDTVPQALLDAHSVKAGVWGVLRVRGGRVRYFVDGESEVSTVVSSGGNLVIAPTELHHVELLDDDSAFFVEFYRPDNAGP